MAKLERTLYVNFDQLLKKLDKEILSASFSASFEDGSDFNSPTCRCSVRVYERYSYFGGNRVSLTITLFQEQGQPIRLSAITSGGSQATFMKINTIGEESFLKVLENILEKAL